MRIWRGLSIQLQIMQIKAEVEALVFERNQNDSNNNKLIKGPRNRNTKVGVRTPF